MKFRALGYIPELDGLRGLAVVAVFLYHGQWLGVESGFVGVDLFFVLSGFLITRLLLEEQGQTGSVDLRGFYIRRALRLFPAVFAMIAALSVLALFSDIQFDARSDIWASVLYVRNYYSMFADAHDGLTSHLWSLAVEEQFYLVWPVVVIALVKRGGIAGLRKVSLCLVLLASSAAVVLSGTGIELVSLYKDTLTHGVVGLVGGAVLGASPHLLSALNERASLWLGVGGLGLLAGFCFIPTYDPTHVQTGFLPVMALALAAVAGAATGGLPFLKFKPLVALGKVSYGLYLWHLPALMIVGHFHPGVTGWTELLEIAALSMAVTLLSYFAIEKPALKLKARFGADRRRGGEPTTESDDLVHALVSAQTK